MWGALAGMATGVIGNLVAGHQQAAAAEEYKKAVSEQLDKQEQLAKDSLYETKAANLATTSYKGQQRKKMFEEALQRQHNRSLVMDEDISKTASMQQQALEQGASEDAQDTVTRINANAQAQKDFTNQMNTISNSRITNLAGVQYQNAVTSANNISNMFSTIGNTMGELDKSYIMKTGKGLFQNAFTKKKNN